jgi:hypothetical protein
MIPLSNLRSIRLGLSFCLSGCLLFLLSISLANAQGALTNGGSHAGEIAVGGSDSWTFSANAGDGVMIRAGSPTFSPRLRVFDAGNALIEDVTNTSLSHRDNYVTFQATTSGTYTVLISASFPAQSGAYLLHLARAPVSAGDEDIPLVNGAEHLGTLPVGGLGLYSFNAGAGDGIMARMGARDGAALSPWLRLYGPDGSLLAEAAHGSSSNRDNFVTAEAPTTGVYTLVVSAVFIGQFGDYGVHLARAPVASGDEALPLINGAEHLGTLPVGGLGFYSFNADAGDGIMARMGARDGAALSPWLRLYGPDGSLLAEAAHGSSSNRDNFVTAEAPAPGVYTLVVSAVFLGQSGDYGVHLARAPVALEDADLPLLNGFAHAGELPVGGLHVGSFAADEGTGIMVRMGARDGAALSPWLRLYGPDGALITEAAHGSSSNRDNFIFAGAPATGIYTVAVSAAHLGQSGAYGLHLALAPGEIIVAEDDQGGEFINGLTYEGEIWMGDVDVWSFHADEGDGLMVRMGTTSGALTPWLRLYGPDGALLTEAASGSSSNRDNYVVADALVSGVHTVAVSAAHFGQTGLYRLISGPGARRIHPVRRRRGWPDGQWGRQPGRLGHRRDGYVDVHGDPWRPRLHRRRNRKPYPMDQRVRSRWHPCR